MVGTLTNSYTALFLTEDGLYEVLMQSRKPISKQLADIAGTSEASITRTQTILEKGSPEDVQEVRDGKASISGKAKEIKTRDKPTEAPKQEKPSTKKTHPPFLESDFLVRKSVFNIPNK